MTKWHYQLIIGGAIVAAILAGIGYQGMETTVFFHTPAEILAAPERFRNKTIRVGARVVPDSTRWDAQRVLLTFQVTDDDAHFIPVVFSGVKPDMYREGQGVVVEGRLDDGGVLQASNLLVKHSAEYSIDQDKRFDKEAAYRSLIR